MRRFQKVRALKFGLLAVIAVTLAGLATMALWNSLMPAIFGLRVVTFWQALGLFILSRILFGRFGGPPRRMHWRHRLMERWSQMSPAEREKFMEGLKGGPHHPRATDPIA